MGMHGIGAGGAGTLKVVNGRLEAKRYVRLICRTLLKDGKKLCGRDFVSQQDGAPCHQANSTMSWFERKGISVSPWPSRSPDLNLMHRTTLGRNKEKVGWEWMQKRGRTKGSYIWSMGTYWGRCNREACFLNASALCICNCCSWRLHQVLNCQTSLYGIVEWPY